MNKYGRLIYKYVITDSLVNGYQARKRFYYFILNGELIEYSGESIFDAYLDEFDDPSKMVAKSPNVDDIEHLIFIWNLLGFGGEESDIHIGGEGKGFITSRYMFEDIVNSDISLLTSFLRELKLNSIFE